MIKWETFQFTFLNIKLLVKLSIGTFERKKILFTLYYPYFMFGKKKINEKKKRKKEYLIIITFKKWIKLKNKCGLIQKWNQFLKK